MRRSVLRLLGIMAVVGSVIYADRSPTGYFNYNSEIRSDQAGYYVYLPAFFIYNFEADELPPDLFDKVARGFSIDTASGLINTKYSLGVALMQSPVFLLIHSYQLLSGGVADGFSGQYHNVINWSSWLYTSLGLWWLLLFLQSRFGFKLAFSLILSIYFGTHLLFYSSTHGGMSHVYSFALFSALLLMLENPRGRPIRPIRALVMGVVIGLILLVRPLNVLAVVFIAGYFQLIHPGYWRPYVRVGRLSMLLLGATLIVLPQMLYWQMLSGNWLYYSYGNESFSNWANPEFAALWLAPFNGLFPYTPLYLVFLLGLGVLFFRQWQQALIFFMLFLALSYFLASWHSPQFGCGFGSRNFVEYTSIFVIPLGGLLSRLKPILKKSIWVVVLLCALVNTKLTYAYGMCFLGDGIWDWKEYRGLLFRGVYRNQVHPGIVSPDDEFSQGIHIESPQLSCMPSYRYADVSAELEMYTHSGETWISLGLSHQDSSLGWWAVNVEKDGPMHEPGSKVYGRIILPDDYPPDARLGLYIWNHGGDSMQVSYLRLWLK